MNSRHVLLGILVVLVFATGYGIARFGTGSTSMYMNGTPTTTAQTGGTQGTLSGANASGSVVVKPSNLTDGQKKMLSVMGIDPNNIVLTPTMIACASTSLGNTRIKELEGGAAPSFTEGLKLAACYK